MIIDLLIIYNCISLLSIKIFWNSLWQILLTYTHTHTHTHNCCCCSVAQSCLTLCDSVSDCSTPGLPVPHQEEYIYIWLCVCVCSVAQLCPTLWDPMDYQAPLSMGFSRQEYWSGQPFPTPKDLPDPGLCLLSWQVNSLPLVPPAYTLISRNNL